MRRGACEYLGDELSTQRSSNCGGPESRGWEVMRGNSKVRDVVEAQGARKQWKSVVDQMVTFFVGHHGSKSGFYFKLYGKE